MPAPHRIRVAHDGAHQDLEGLRGAVKAPGDGEALAGQGAAIRRLCRAADAGGVGVRPRQHLAYELARHRQGMRSSKVAQPRVFVAEAGDVVEGVGPSRSAPRPAPHALSGLGTLP